MNADPKNAQDDPDLDEALSGTFPASDPVAPSHVEDEMERRRKVLEEDAKKKREELQRAQTSHSEALLDEGLDETFPASDPVAVHHIEEPPLDPAEARMRERESEPSSKPIDKRKQRAVKGQKKTPRRRANPAGTGRRTGQKKTHSKKRKSMHGAPDTRRKKAPRKASAQRKKRRT